MIHLKKFSLLALASVVFAVGSRAGTPLPFPSYMLENDGMVLGKWLLVGPFESKDQRKAIDMDFLDRYGSGENETGFEGIAVAASGNGPWGPLTRISDRGETMNFSVIFGVGWMLPGSPDTAVYAACEITAADKREAWLMLGSDDGVKIWLNGQERLVRRERRDLKIYDDAIPLPLRRGRNLLVAKVTSAAGFWQMAVRLEPNREAALHTVLARPGGYLRRDVLERHEQLELSVRGLVESTPLEARITACDGQFVRRVRLGEAQTQAVDPSGLYRLTVSAADREYETWFCCGSIPEIHALMEKEAKRVIRVDDERSSLNADALLRRLDVLSRPFQPGPNDPEGAREAFLERNRHKAVYTAAALAEILQRFGAREEPFRHRSGLHLRGFRSRIDDQIMHYRQTARYRRSGF